MKVGMTIQEALDRASRGEFSAEDMSTRSSYGATGGGYIQYECLDGEATISLSYGRLGKRISVVTPDGKIHNFSFGNPLSIGHLP